MIYRSSAFAILLCCCGAADAYGPLRCKGKIIDPGATMAEVLELCGEPAARIEAQMPIRAGTVTGHSRIIGYGTTRQWVYDRGFGRFPAVVKFDDGEVRRIDYLRYRSGGAGR